MRSSALILSLTLTLPVPAQAPPSKALAVSPAAEPRPAMRYELLPSLRDRQPGNAAVSYFRAFLHRPSPPADPKQAAAAEKAFEELWDAPLDTFPKDAARKRLEPYRNALKEVDAASVAESCDWQMAAKLRADGLAALLPEVQPSRELVRYLGLRAKLELSEDRFDDAARTIRTGLRMAKDVGEGGTLIQLLVGLALEAIMLDRVDDWISRPGSPNLYWALTNLPHPLVDPRPGFQGEELFFTATVPNLTRLRGGPIPKDEAPRLLEGVMSDLRRMGGAAGDRPSDLEATLGQFGFTGYVVWQYPSAKRELIARGRTEKEVEAMPGAQAVLLNSLERYLDLRDEQWKLLGLPYHQAAPALAKAAARFKKEQAENRNDPLFTVFSLVLPASEKVLFAAARADRKVALLRTVEAVRMHAAAHGGMPPASLADVTVVPVPDDPVTGKPFEYAVAGRVVKLNAPPPAGEKSGPQNSVRYELTVR